MENKSKYLVKNIVILTISNFASKILVFLLVPLYTSFLSTEEVGIYDLILSTVSLLIPILTLNIIDAVMRFSMEDTNSVEEVAIIGIRFIFRSIIIAIVCLLFLKRLGLLYQIEGLECLIILYYIFSVIYSYMIQFSKGLERVMDMGIAGVIGTVSMIVANICFLYIFQTGLKGFFISNILGQVIPTLYLIIRIKMWRYIKCLSVNRSLQKEMILYCCPLIATTIGWWVNSASDRYVVSVMCGLGSNGILSVAYKIPQVINTLHGIFTQAWQLSAIKEYKNYSSAEYFGKAFSFINLMLAVTCSVLIILSKHLAYVLYRREFFEAWKYVPFLLISCAINSASGFCGTILSAKKDTKSMAMSAIYGSIVNLFFNIFLVYFWGIQGATIATVVSSYVIYEYRRKAIADNIYVEKYYIIPLIWLFLCAQSILEIYTNCWCVELIILFVIILLNKYNISYMLKLIINAKNYKRE